MKLDDATREALRDPVTRRLLQVFLCGKKHREEFEALREAEENNNLEKLAELVETKGELRVPDARAYVAARLRGENRKRGNKRTIENILRRIRLFMEVQDCMHTFQESQANALRRALEMRTSFVDMAFETYANSHAGEEPVGEMRDFLDQISAEAESGLREDFKKGRAELREVLESLGFAIGPALQVRDKKRDTE